MSQLWLGERISTLEDLLSPSLRAVCIGINPAPLSVEVGHYYQGRLGTRIFGRLIQAGAFDQGNYAFEDDAAFSAGIGFTDIVKRPTARGTSVKASEFRHRKDLLERKLDEIRPALVIFTFKKAATVMLGDVAGNGLLPGVELAGSPVFIMPGPYEARDSASATMDQIAFLAK